MDTIATTLDSGTISVGESLIVELRGELMLLDHSGYDQARRVWHGNVNRPPAHYAYDSSGRDSTQTTITTEF